MKPSFMVWSVGYGPSLEKLTQMLNQETAAERHLAQYDGFIASQKLHFLCCGGCFIGLCGLLRQDALFLYQIPAGLFSSFIGAPYFIYLLRKQSRYFWIAA